MAFPLPPEISFHVEPGGHFPHADHEPALRTWIEAIITQRGGTLGVLNYIFCGDDYLHALNVQYLQHDTLTDIITFPHAEFPLISGDLFISTERVADNARDFHTSFTDELHRVMIHGVLHLCGQNDKTGEDAGAMRELESKALDDRGEELIDLD